MNFLFVCGGTAGHINPALAIAGKIRTLMPDAGFLFVGSGREMEKRLIPRECYELKNISITGFSRKISISSLKSNLKLLNSLSNAARQSEKIIRDFAPDIVIGTGGYVCYPVLKKAAQMGIPTLLHESNAIPGMTTKMLSDKVNNMLVAFPGVSKYYRKPEKVIVTGTPVRSGFASMTKEEARELLKLDNKPLVVSFWGSLGAAKMNEYMTDFIKQNIQNAAFNHIHATGGEASLIAMKDRLLSADIGTIPPYVDLRVYINDMDTVMTAADLVLCRAGASTIAELTLMGKPAILVPSPNVTNNHQEKNAREVEKHGGAKTILESECSGSKLFEEVTKILADQKLLSGMSAASNKLGFSNSCEKIVDIIFSLIN